jgi:hypothetical protein
MVKAHKTHERRGNKSSMLRGKKSEKKKNNIYIRDQQMKGVKVGCE